VNFLIQLKYRISLLLITITLSSLGQRVVDKEWFYLSGSSIYSVEDGYVGINGKFAFPMQRGFYFVSQASLFPSALNNTHDEYRYMFNVELVPYKGKVFSFNLQTGLDYGYWRRTQEIEFVQNTKSFYKDQSIMFGFGLNFELEKVSFIIEHRYLPEISRNHTAIGIKLQFFENKKLRKKYMQYRLRKRLNRART